jgi:hypothetical protein
MQKTSWKPFSHLDKLTRIWYWHGNMSIYAVFGGREKASNEIAVWKDIFMFQTFLHGGL